MILEFCSETSTGTEWVTENQCQELLTTLCCLPRPLPLQQIPKNCSKLSSNFVLCKDKPSPRAVKAGSQWAEKTGRCPVKCHSDVVATRKNVVSQIHFSLLSKKKKKKSANTHCTFIRPFAFTISFNPPINFIHPFYRG